MSLRYPVDAAERLFRDMLGTGSSDEIPSFDGVVAALRAFVATDFEVHEEHDGDGFLFQYGAFRYLPEPGFWIGFVRQFDVVDRHGEHECFEQLQIEYRYAIDPVLETAGTRTDWWFKPGDGVPFDRWLQSVLADPVWPLLTSRSAIGFRIHREAV